MKVTRHKDSPERKQMPGSDGLDEQQSLYRSYASKEIPSNMVCELWKALKYSVKELISSELSTNSQKQKDWISGNTAAICVSQERCRKIYLTNAS